MKRALTFVGILAMATACSSGGGTGSTTPAQLPPAQTLPATAAPQAVGSTTLTIKFPGNFVQATAAATGKHAQYVNPLTTNFIDVYVDQQLVLLSGGPTYDTAQVNTTNGDGTQSITIPLYSTSTNDIVVAERDSGGPMGTVPGNLLALGQTNSSFTAGTSNTPTIAMSMNLYGFAYSTNGTSATALALGPPLCLGTYPGYSASNNYYLIPVDARNGALLNPSSPSGTNGVPAITTSATPAVAGASPPPTNITQNALGAYNVNYDTLGDDIYQSINATNPAYNVYYYNLSPNDRAMLPAYTYGATTYSLNWSIKLSPAGICV